MVPVQDGVRDPAEPRREVEYEQDIWLRVPFDVNQDNVKCRILDIFLLLKLFVYVSQALKFVSA
jgi:hypothetical protein